VIWPVRDHLGHVRVAHQRLERPRAERVVEHGLDQSIEVTRRQGHLAAQQDPRARGQRSPRIGAGDSVLEHLTANAVAVARNEGGRIGHATSSLSSSSTAG
jgi:hypothetical protein